MVPNPIVIRSAQRRDGSRVVVLEETVGQEGIIRAIELDEMTFESIERALQTHPFRRRRPEEDIVLFKSLDTPVGTDKKYFDLEIVNHGSRHHLRIEASLEAFAAMKTVFDSWCERMKAARGVRRPSSS